MLAFVAPAFFMRTGWFSATLIQGGRTMRGIMLKAVLVSAAVPAMLAGTDLSARIQSTDLAARLSGTWVFNRDLSIGFGAARGRGQARFAMGFAAGQRRPGGGGGGDASDLTPEQRAEQAAMRQLQQIDARITIKAAADTVTFIDSRGERTYAVNDKASEVYVASAPVKVKSKWDKQVLKQEFSNTQAKLVQTWTVDGSDHLVL